MKNNLLYSCIAVFLFRGLLAQVPELRDHKVISKFEATAGVGLLKSETGLQDNKSMIGYSFGVGVSHTFSKTFELKGRALYELKGSKTTTHGDGVVDGMPFNTTSTITTDLYYVTLSLMPTFHFTSSKNVLAGTGAFYSIMNKIRISEVRTDNITGVTTIINHSGGNTTYLTNQRDFGISVYAGYVFDLSKKTDLTFMLHYNKSLTDYNDAYNTWQRNNVFLFSATFGLFR